MTSGQMTRGPATGGPLITPPRDRLKLRRRLAGVAFLVVLALLVWLSLAAYGKKFAPAAMVTLYTDSAGNEMHVGSLVVVRGVQVGEVRQITTAGHGARLLLAIQPGQLHQIPANVSAEMLPTTLFGERFVDLILPATPSARTLANGSVIGQNRTRDALELEKVLNNLLPVLTSSEPDKLSLLLTALARGLQGRGRELGQTLVTLSADLGRLNPNLPALDTDIAGLVQLTRGYRQALPQVLQALSDFAVTNQTIASERANYAALLANVTTAANDIHGFLNANSRNAIQLGTDSLSTLRILAAYAPEFPCALRDLANFVPNVDRVLGRGTKQPGLHVQVVVVPSLGRYLPSSDTPIYGDNLGPHCYPIPFPGIHLNDGAGPPNATGASVSAPQRQGPGGQAAGGSSPTPTANPRAPRANGGNQSGPPPSQRIGSPDSGATPSRWIGSQDFGATPAWVAGSPPESELVRELAALSLRQPPASLPGWSGLLVAPLYRDARVTLGVSRA